MHHFIHTKTFLIISVCLSVVWKFNLLRTFNFSHVGADGFSPFPSILTYFPDLDDSNLPPHWDMQQSLSDSSPTILLDASTGENKGNKAARINPFLRMFVCLSIICTFVRLFIYSFCLLANLQGAKLPHFAELDSSWPVGVPYKQFIPYRCNFYE